MKERLVHNFSFVAIQILFIDLLSQCRMISYSLLSIRRIILRCLIVGARVVTPFLRSAVRLFINWAWGGLAFALTHGCVSYLLDW